MLDSLFSLPQSIPSLWRSLHAGKKRRVATVASRFCSNEIEGLEERQLLSAANGREHGGDPRIINGTTTAAFTAVGQLTFTPTGGTAVQSTGTLISTQWVLTAASASNGLSQTGGSATVLLGGVTYTVDQIVTYPKYNSGSIDFKQNIALWHITAAVPGTITPATISYAKPSAGSTATLVGFGLTGTGTTGATGSYGTKQTATTKIEQVTASILKWKLDSNSEGTTATGDTGGPVLNSSGVIVGIVSGHSTTTSKIGDLAYNTRVDIYAGWIDNILGRAHPTVTTVDDYIDTADTVGTTNRLFNLSSTATSFSVHGRLSQYGDVDVFKVVTAASGYATFNLSNYSTTSLLDTKLEILSSNGTTVLFTSDDNSATDLTSKLQCTLAAGTYYVKVSTYANAGKGEYNLSMTDVADVVGDVIGSPKTLTATKQGVFSTSVLINTTTDVDYYKVTLTKNADFQFEFTPANPGTLDPMITVYNSAGTLLDSNDDYITGVKASRLKLFGLTSGTVLYIKASSSNSTAGIGTLTIRPA